MEMTEHVHEWKWLSGYSKEQKAHISGIMCLCGEQMSIEQAESRLNEYETLKAATERLSAEDVRAGLALGWVTGLRDKMKAYADTLEAK